MRQIRLLSFLLLLPVFALQAQEQDTSLSFFLTSEGIGDGGNLGGLEGADRHCQMLAERVGAGHKTWRAYLSTQGPDAVNARDRIGQGPWYNFYGRFVAMNLEDLHNHRSKVNFREAVTEDGLLVPADGYVGSRHDILTGTQPDGTAFPPGTEDLTCQNWTSNDAGRARIGHHDQPGWNSRHDSRGCSQEAFLETRGHGLFYCFAAD